MYGKGGARWKKELSGGSLCCESYSAPFIRYSLLSSLAVDRGRKKETRGKSRIFRAHPCRVTSTVYKNIPGAILSSEMPQRFGEHRICNGWSRRVYALYHAKYREMHKMCAPFPLLSLGDVLAFCRVYFIRPYIDGAREQKCRRGVALMRRRCAKESFTKSKLREATMIYIYISVDVIRNHAISISSAVY